MAEWHNLWLIGFRLSNFTCNLWMIRGGSLLILGRVFKGQELWHSVYKTTWARLQFLCPPPPPPQKRFGVYRNHPVCLFVYLSRVNLTLAITFDAKEIRHSYYIFGFLETIPFCPYQKKKIDLVTLALNFDLHLKKKLNLGCNFWTKRDRAFMSHMWVPFDKTFRTVPTFLTFWPWPWLLTFFWKN